MRGCMDNVGTFRRRILSSGFFACRARPLRGSGGPSGGADGKPQRCGLVGDAADRGVDLWMESAALRARGGR